MPAPVIVSGVFASDFLGTTLMLGLLKNLFIYYFGCCFVVSSVDFTELGGFDFFCSVL